MKLEIEFESLAEVVEFLGRSVKGEPKTKPEREYQPPFSVVIDFITRDSAERVADEIRKELGYPCSIKEA